VDKFKSNSIKWKVAFMNSKINSHPQSKKIKTENLGRFILQLKADDLYAEYED
jgi:hypothetical protein